MEAVLADSSMLNRPRWTDPAEQTLPWPALDPLRTRPGPAPGRPEVGSSLLSQNVVGYAVASRGNSGRK